MGLFQKKKTKRIVSPSSVSEKKYDVINDRPDHRETLRVGDKDYYLSVRELENAPLNLTLTLDDIETKKVFCILTIDLGDIQIANPTKYMPLYHAYLDTKHNEGVLDFLKKRKICDITPTTIPRHKYGWEPAHDFEYPLCIFLPDTLKKYDYDGWVKYEKRYREEHSRLDSSGNLWSLWVENKDKKSLW